MTSERSSRLIARTYYDEPTCTGWMLGTHRCHVELFPWGVNLRLGNFTAAVAVTAPRWLADRDEWEATR